MRHVTEARRDRVQLRLDANTKRKLERAAAYEQKTVTQFVLACASSEAERVIEQHERVTLSVADWDAFYEALIKPPKPNKALRDAIGWYRGLSR